jgi:hypothetical protein
VQEWRRYLGVLVRHCCCQVAAWGWHKETQVEGADCYQMVSIGL